ncbi:MAG: penicillin-binding protein 2 [Proteobacteria bacterium]|nr:penicillin-binding protein 2 [Pseudomonadota bacterium]
MKASRKDLESRVTFVLAVVLLGFVGVLVRAFWLQILPDQKLKLLARRQFESRIQVQNRRANILDRDSKPLIVSTRAYSFFMDPKKIENPKLFSKKAGKLLSMDSKKLYKKIMEFRQRRFVWLKRHLPENEAKLIISKKLDSLYFVEEFKREPIRGRLASHVLGFTSRDGRGLEGVERYFDKYLDRDPHVLTIEKDALGRSIYRQLSHFKEPDQEIVDLKLSIDSSLQYFVEKSLEATIEKFKARGGTVIVMDPYSGEIYALANYPDFDLSSPNQYPATFRRNRAVTDPIEPGSVLKPFLVAESIEKSLVNEDTWIATPGGKVKVADRWIHEADKEHEKSGYKVKDLIKHSSNVATVNLLQKVGSATLYSAYKKVGFGELTGVEIPGESRGIVRWPGAKQIVEQATWSFGQGIAVTPLQIIRAYAALANGGFKVKPHLVGSRISRDGRVQSEVNNNSVGERIFSEKTTARMTKLLESVVEEEGTGTLARLEHFKVAGKTGTSQKPAVGSSGYQKGSYIASFVGYFPSEAPRFVVYVNVDEPQKIYYGGLVAGPLFSEIARQAMRMNPLSSIAR